MVDSLVENAQVVCGRSATMIGESAAFRQAYRLLQRYAVCNVPVLIEGDTGTGKELAAREVHYASARRQGPFVPINCGALPDSLIESALFGHRRGAFTDAKSNELGLVEYARGGTLFLDEIDSLPPHAQATLLRFLQNGEFRAVGEGPLRIADVRVVAATNLSLAAAVESGSFRRDLFYRLNPLYVRLPALSERGDDVILLAKKILCDVVGRLEVGERDWSADALEALKYHDWPGNVRELENMIVRACMCSDRDIIGLSELAQAEPAIWARYVSSHANVSAPEEAKEEAREEVKEEIKQGFAISKQLAIQLFERTYLIALMRRADGNVSRAAQLSGTERRQLGKMLKRHGIEHHCPVSS
jgi:DNA-binding NtrC family response regulator